MADPNQLVVLECDWMTQDDCWLRSAPVSEAEVEFVDGWWHLQSGDTVCMPCYQAFKRVEKEWQ